MLIRNIDWNNLSEIQKKERLLRAYIENLEIRYTNGGFENKELESRIRESKFVLDLVKERIA